VLWRPNSHGGAGRGEFKIDMPNDECLMYIFSFLSMRERIKVERGKLFWAAAHCIWDHFVWLPVQFLSGV
jgi:hypothetical protein